jgi:RHS repeat-associated protein
VGFLTFVLTCDTSLVLSASNMARLVGTTTSYSFLTSRNFTNAYTYDAASDRTGFTDPESGSTTYSYDTLNRLTSLAPPSAFGSGSFGFGYDALSRRTQMTRPNSVTTNYAYDNLSRLTSVLHQLAGSTIDGATYTLDNAGNRTAKTDQRAAVTSNYTYDAIYQLTQVMQGTNTTESYSYDAVGNRTASLGVSSYTTNASNELTATSNASYTYDSNGNTLTKTLGSNTTTYAWDFENRLTSVTLPGSGGTVSFKYDPLGRRIYKSSSSGTSVFAYDGDNQTEETNSSGTVVARYSETENTDEPLAMLRSGTTDYYEQDGLSSVTSSSNTAGSLTQTYTYDSFGKLTASSGSLTNLFQYTAREFDAETGLYFNRARYYDPQSGRFISEDPLEFAGSGPSFYVYANNHSVDWVDPFGLAVTCPSFLARWCQPPPPPPIPAPPQPPWYSPATRHHPAPPSPQLGILLDCIAHSYGAPIFYNSTSEYDPKVGHIPDTPHGRGEAADIEYPANPADADKILCAAAGCGASFAKDELKHPSAKSTGPHVHVQLGPRRGGRGDLPPSDCACSK